MPERNPLPLSEQEPNKPDKPRHKILCRRKFYRYVVACMHNCQEPHFCEEFWGFFKAVGKTPAEYYNDDGIGEATMRRVVFDCDRCGKKDVGTMFGLFDEQGETDSNRLPEEGFAKQVHQMGFRENLLVGLVHGVLTKLQEVRRWNHYCDKCFRRVVEDLADVAQLKRSGAKKLADEPTPAPKVTPAKVIVPEPVPVLPPPPPVPEEPEEPQVEKAPRGRPKGGSKPKPEPVEPPKKAPEPKATKAPVPEPKATKAPAGKPRSAKDGLPL